MSSAFPLLCSGAAAALAAVSIVFKQIDPGFASTCVGKAQSIFRLATSQDAAPKSFCSFVPCTTNVTVLSQVRGGVLPAYKAEGPRHEPSLQVVIKPQAQVNASSGAGGECFFIDWTSKTCRIGFTLEDCAAQKAVNEDVSWIAAAPGFVRGRELASYKLKKVVSVLQVYEDRLDCCNSLYQSNITSESPQGICLVSVGSWSCFVADQAQRCGRRGIRREGLRICKKIIYQA